MAGIATTKHEYAGSAGILPVFFTASSYELHVRRHLIGSSYGRHETTTGLRFLNSARHRGRTLERYAYAAEAWESTARERKQRRNHDLPLLPRAKGTRSVAAEGTIFGRSGRSRITRRARHAGLVLELSP